MIAAIATIIFLAVAWVAIVAIAGSLEDHLAQIATALRAEARSPQPQLAALRLSPRYPHARSQRVRARPALRAAA